MKDDTSENAEEWSDIKPASALPWAAHDLRDDEGQVQDANFHVVAGRLVEVCVRDAYYIATACNAYPTMRRQLAEARAEMTKEDARTTEGA